MIIIDSREALAHPIVVTDIMRALGRDNVMTKQTIEFGDYLFTGTPLTTADDAEEPKRPTIAIELCSVPDLCGKVNSGRLAFQLGGMLERYDFAILLVESPLQSDRDGYVRLPGGARSISFERLMDVLLAAQVHGTRLLFCRDRAFVPDRILQLYHYFNKPLADHKAFRPTPARQLPTIPVGEAIDARVSLLMGLPGIGEDKATAALKRFGSVAEIMVMPEELLKTIPGWGIVTAKRVRTFLDRNMNAEAVNPVTPEAVTASD